MYTLPIKQEKRDILHIDADAFFASVEQVLNPQLRGKPVLIGGSRTKGIVSTASYEAKRFGIHSGMAMYLAIKRCPQATVVKGNFQAYRDFSRRMHQIFQDFTDEVEMSSIDEAYLDVTGLKLMKKASAYEIAKNILMTVYQELGISVSCGLASNKTVAKVASSENKPHKLTHVPFGKERGFLAPLPLRAIPGIGAQTFLALKRFGLQKIGDLSELSSSEVIDRFGVNMIPIWKKSIGADNRPVIANRSLPKSISKEKTFFESHPYRKEHLKILRQLLGLVLIKLRAYDMKANTVFLKIRYKAEDDGRDGKKRKPFDDNSFQVSLGGVKSLDTQIFPIVQKLFLEKIERRRKIRLIGVGVSNLLKNYNLSLFKEDTEREMKLFKAYDGLRKVYGEEVLQYGA